MRFSNHGTSNCDALFLSTWKFTAPVATKNLVPSVQAVGTLLISCSYIELVDKGSEFTEFFLFDIDFFKLFQFLIELSICPFFYQCVFVSRFLHSIFEWHNVVIKSFLKFFWLNENSRICNLASINNLLIWSCLFTIKNVLLYRVVKQSRLLHYQSHSFPQHFDVILLYIDTVNQNLAEISIVKPHQKTN